MELHLFHGVALILCVVSLPTMIWTGLRVELDSSTLIPQSFWSGMGMEEGTCVEKLLGKVDQTASFCFSEVKPKLPVGVFVGNTIGVNVMGCPHRWNILYLPVFLNMCGQYTWYRQKCRLPLYYFTLSVVSKLRMSTAKGLAGKRKEQCERVLTVPRSWSPSKRESWTYWRQSNVGPLRCWRYWNTSAVRRRGECRACSAWRRGGFSGGSHLLSMSLLKQRLEQMASKGLFQPQPFCDSVMLQSSTEPVASMGCSWNQKWFLA